MIPGVANRDARLVFDARAAALAQLVAGHKTSGNAAEPAPPETALGDALGEMVLLALWRAGSLTSLDALSENVLGFDPSEAVRLAAEGCARARFPPEPLDEGLVALWLRAEAALLEAGIRGRVCAGLDAEGNVLRIDLHPARAASGLVAIGRRQVQLLASTRPVRDRPDPRGGSRSR